MGRKKHVEHEEHVNHERWLVSYADFITLLMIFFVVMYSMSKTDVEKYEAVSKELAIFFGGNTFFDNSTSGVLEGGMNLAATGPLETDTEGSNGGSDGNSEDSQSGANANADGQDNGANGANGTDNGSTGQDNTQGSNGTDGSTTGTNGQNVSGGGLTADQMGMAETYKEVNELLQQMGMSDQVSVGMEDRGVVISIGNALLFSSGSAEIKPQSRAILTMISQVLNKTENYIRVEGFTDNIPMKSDAFSSNWELASQRAINVTKMLIDDGVDPFRLSASSFGEYRPTVPNTSADNRAQNRRVTIVVLSQEYSKSEPGAK